MHQPRKVSSGLAARMKALGFGNVPKQVQSKLVPEVGRLSEDQIRQIDERHQANSTTESIERRGRAWRGPGASLQILRSKSSRSSIRSSHKNVDLEAAEIERPSTAKPDLLPEIAAQPPLEMDPNKYRLPDHTNGNGTKALPDTRQEHINRDSRIPSEDEQTEPESVEPDPSEPELSEPAESTDEEDRAEQVVQEEQEEQEQQEEQEALTVQVVEIGPAEDQAPSPPIMSPPPPPPPAMSPPPVPPPVFSPPPPPPPVLSPPPPPPPPKDTPPGSSTPSEFNPDSLDFNPLGLQRPGSIYTISRLSFANQLAQLTSLQLPDAETLSHKISAIPTAQVAAKALINAADQIRMWIYKASEVISGLDSDGDVEWAAAGGREGYEEVENAITRFEELINIYVSAIEELQCRNDIGSVSGEDLQRAVTQMEAILEEWAKIRSTLRVAKIQIEIAMEWEELWNSVLGEIQNEMDELSRLVFEMEERRHKSLMAVANGDGVDIKDLETIVEETPPAVARTTQRMSIAAFPLSPEAPAGPALTQDDSSLLALFARMQPLRASLDFLPMRLSGFENRADQAFPAACEELQERSVSLEESYKKLEKDAESLRKELGEDKWVLVFRGAGRQAQKMCESVERSVGKLREGIDSGMHLTNPAVLSKKIESYEAKKMHYGPAIERVFSIIDKGVKDRLTVNGEILRLHAEMQSKWDDVKNQMQELDLSLEEVQADRGQTLRDSISSMLSSNDRSTIASGHDTPGSSPPSSVVMSSLGFDPTTPLSKRSTNRSTSMGSAKTTTPKPNAPRSKTARRTLAPPSQITRKPASSRLSTVAGFASSLSSLAQPRGGSATPSGPRVPPRSSSSLDTRPRWNSSVNINDSDVGHNFKPLSLTNPSQYQNPTSPPPRNVSSLTPNSANSKIPMLRSPLSRLGSKSPMPDDSPSRQGSSRLSFRDRVSSPGPYAQQTLAKPRLARKASMSALNGNRRSSLQASKADGPEGERRAVSSMATSRRISMLPQPKDSGIGRYSPQAIAGARSAMSKMSLESRSESRADSSKDYKPRWRF